MERERAPHRMFCFGRTHVRRRATGAAANAYASRLGYLNSSSTHGATADGPATDAGKKLTALFAPKIFPVK